jgi:membrane protease YdiL (CAAX protease family)
VLLIFSVIFIYTGYWRKGLEYAIVAHMAADVLQCMSLCLRCSAK